jgi:hypothetical protein
MDTKDVNMETEEVRPKSPIAVSMKYGAFAGISIVIVTIVYILLTNEMALSGGFQLLTWAIFTVFMVYGIKYHRDHELDGYINFWKATGTGTLISLFTWVITGFFWFIYFNFFLSDARIEEYKEQSMQLLLEITERWMDPDNERTAEVVEKIKEDAESATRMKIATDQFKGNLVYTPFGALIAMIASIFLKKSRPEYI